jgi:hypothetical protein
MVRVNKTRRVLHGVLVAAIVWVCGANALEAQTPAPTPTHANILRGEYGRYRANNDLLYYHLDVRVDPDKKYLKGAR